MVNLGSVMEKWAGVIVEALRKEVKRDDTYASGRLQASIHPQIKIFGNKFEMQILMEDYWKQVDEGQKPGKKPEVSKILKWMRHKGIQPKPTKSNLTKPRSAKSRKLFKDRRLAMAERIAEAIKRRGTIKRFGYKGSGFVTDYTKTLAERMMASIREATGKDITIQIKNVIK